MHIKVLIQQLDVVTEIRPCSTVHILIFVSLDCQRPSWKALSSGMYQSSLVSIIHQKILQTAETLGLVWKYEEE